MLVLVIAPGAQGLDVARDLRAAAQGVAVTALEGTVSRREALAEIASGRYAVLHLAGHGDRSGFAVTDGRISGHVLRQAVAAGGVSLLILNFCVSIPLAAAIHGQGVAKVISWRDEVPDEQAAAWAGWFYRSLALADGDVWEAYRVSVEAFEDAYPGSEVPIWLNGRLAKMQEEIRVLQVGQADRGHERRITIAWLALVAVLLVIDGLLSTEEVRLALGVPPLVAAPGRAVLLFTVLLVILGRVGVLRR